MADPYSITDEEIFNRFKENALNTVTDYELTLNKGTLDRRAAILEMISKTSQGQVYTQALRPLYSEGSPLEVMSTNPETSLSHDITCVIQTLLEKAEPMTEARRKELQIVLRYSEGSKYVETDDIKKVILPLIKTERETSSWETAEKPSKRETTILLYVAIGSSVILGGIGYTYVGFIDGVFLGLIPVAIEQFYENKVDREHERQLDTIQIRAQEEGIHAVEFYRNQPEDIWRSAVHSSIGETMPLFKKWRLA